MWRGITFSHTLRSICRQPISPQKNARFCDRSSTASIKKSRWSQAQGGEQTLRRRLACGLGGAQRSTAGEQWVAASKALLNESKRAGGRALDSTHFITQQGEHWGAATLELVGSWRSFQDGQEMQESSRARHASDLFHTTGRESKTTWTTAPHCSRTITRAEDQGNALLSKQRQREDQT